MPNNPHGAERTDDSTDPSGLAAARRLVLRAGLLGAAGLMLGGCASKKKTADAAERSRVAWPELDGVAKVERADRADRSWGRDWTPPDADRYDNIPSAPGNIMRRSSWATAGVIPSRMDRMLPVRRITVHHDGLDPVSLSSQRAVAQRIDMIRGSHQDGRGWGDIGYHFVVDPMGGVWEGRTLAWQGAHVGKQNEGNLGVVCLGNFERQNPTSAQLAALDGFLAQCMRRYRVPASRVKTHQEMASTACPGRSLQAHMNRTRSRGGVVASVSV